jgi:hypothetical protein
MLISWFAREALYFLLFLLAIALLYYSEQHILQFISMQHLEGSKTLKEVYLASV